MSTHKRTCPAYGNYQPPYEDCNCGADDEPFVIEATEIVKKYAPGELGLLNHLVNRFRKIAAVPIPSSSLDAETIQLLRQYLWLGHGHTHQYGDDGEMQCGQCAPIWDYKRAPLADVIRQAAKARQEVNITELMKQQTRKP